MKKFWNIVTGETDNFISKVTFMSELYGIWKNISHYIGELSYYFMTYFYGSISTIVCGVE